MGAVMLQQLRGFDVWIRAGALVLVFLLVAATIRGLRRLGADSLYVRGPGSWRSVIDSPAVPTQTFRL
jgi:hypothetical protein